MINRVKERAFVLMAMAWLSGAFASAEECFLPLIEPEQEAIWPYLADSTVSGIFDRPVTLKHGQYEGLPFVPDGHARPALRLWPELMRSADLDGRGGEEKIGLLSETSGGSGERVYLLAARSIDGGYHAWPAVLIGDRVKVRSLRIRNAEIVLEIVEAGPDEAFCCGTQLSRLVYRLSDRGLVLKDREIQGRLSIGILQDTHWVLLDRPGERLNALHPACVEMWVQDDQITWDVGGQRYTGILDEKEPGNIAISNVAPAIPDPDADRSQQERLIARLSKVVHYTFRAGRLLLTGPDNRRALAFEFADAREYPDASVDPE